MTQDQDHLAAASNGSPGGAWVPVTERMPASGVTVLACYTNSAGKVRRIRAEWVAAKTIESDADSEISEYDETTDCYYDPEGWYEKIDNWGDYSSVVVNEGEVTHWMPLPAHPDASPPPAQPPQNPWRDAIDEALVVAHIGVATEPYDDLNKLLQWHHNIWLDPAVSSDAAALVEQGRAEIAKLRQGEPVALTDDLAETFVTQYNDVYCDQRRAGVTGGDAERKAMREVLTLALGALASPPPSQPPQAEPACGCRIGECESKPPPLVCRMTEEIKRGES